MDPPMKHPLFLHGVLANVFSFLPQSDLRNCHLVCEFWLNEAWITTIRRKTVTLSNEKDVQSFMAFFNQNLDRRHFSKYKFGPGDFGREPDAILAHFFEQFGPSIHSLDLHTLPVRLTMELQAKLVNLKRIAVQASQVELESPLRIRIRYNLEELALYFKASTHITNLHEIVVLDALLLHSGRTLKFLSLNPAGGNLELEPQSVELSKRLYQALLNYTRGQPSVLEELNYNFPLDSGDMAGFAKEIRFPRLKSLAIQLNDSRPNPRALSSFLETYDTIQELDLRFFSWCNPGQPFLFPKLEYLTCLTLHRYRGELQFLRECPNLREVKLLKWRVEFTTNGHPPTPATASLRRTSLPRLESVTSATVNPVGFPQLFMIIRYITWTFPNLSRLQFDANINVEDQDKYSEFISINLPQLKQLHVKKLSDNLYDDSAAVIE